jgi:hypothetical protein
MGPGQRPPVGGRALERVQLPRVLKMEREPQRKLGTAQAPLEGVRPDRRAQLKVEFQAWGRAERTELVLPPRVGETARAPELSQETRNTPARPGLLVLRKGLRPDRDGESASGSTSDPSRHVAYPGLLATPGQGKGDVSRETIVLRPE